MLKNLIKQMCYSTNDVKTDKNGIFSVLIHTYTMRGIHDANGVNYVKRLHI